MKKLCLITALAAASIPAVAQDTVEYLDGNTRSGRIVGANERVFQLRIPAPMPGQQGAVISINRADVDKILFGPDPDLETVTKDPSLGRLAFARVLWQRQEPFLSVPESNAAKAGMVYGDILLLSTDPARHNEALAIFQRIEKEAWDETDRDAATRGRLKALLRLGRVEEASAEAQVLAEQAEDPGLLLETKLLLAQTRIAALRELLDDNPRWSQDPPVREERSQLLNDALDLSLYPFLFHGTEHDQAAQGLWLAHEAYLLAGDTAAAREVASDIVSIYPQTRYAGPAREALQEKEPES
ncbi:MAG: hypothetical protein WEC73_00165 [Chthoniobacterales bacterium]